MSPAPHSDRTEAVRATLLSVCDLIEGQLEDLLSQRFRVAWKRDGSPVTDADLAIESAIHNHLRERLGEIEFVGEESHRAQPAVPTGWRAVVDPIDGTENFCSGLKIWGTSVSLWYDAHHVGSMLYAPELGERLMTGDTVTPIQSRITGFSSSLSDDLASQLVSAGEARMLGCAVYNLMNVIRGSFQRFVNPVGAYSWDLLAGVQLALEQGCNVEVDGKPYGGEYLEPGRRYRVDIRR